jgi:ribonuclease Z
MFDLTFLGTAATTPSAERGLPALLVGAGSERFLVDCGEGTQRQMLRAGIGFRRLGHVLLTHAHLDHVLGLAGLLSTLALFDLKGEVAICGSRQTLGFVELYFAAIWGRGRAPVALRLEPLEPGPVFAGREYTLRCFAVRHRDTESLGFRFETTPRRHLDAALLAELGVPPGELRAALARGEAVALPDGRRIDPEMVEAGASAASSVAVIGDVEETRSLVEAVADAGALVIEATFLDADADLAARRGHLTAGTAARLAAEARVGALYLTHLSGRYEAAAVLAEARHFFPNTAVMNDFDQVSLARAASPPRG